MRYKKYQVEPRKTEVRGIICRMYEIPGTAGTRLFLESCLSSNNVFTILPELLTAYQNNFITVDPQVQLLHTLILLAHRNNFHRMAIALVFCARSTARLASYRYGEPALPI
jgi:hypothetical protein